MRALRREAELLERLAHPVLVRGFGSVLDSDYPHVLLEYLDGVNLRRLVKRHGPLPLEQLLPLALDVSAALHYLSVEGVVHLDVKPANIMVVVPPRLIDLGTARSLETAAERRTPIGTAAYRAPEQCDPDAYQGIGSPADVWGLGATLYYAIAGEPPFQEPASLPKGVPPPLEGLVMQMLAANPSERPRAAEVAETLEPMVSDLSTL